MLSLLKIRNIALIGELAIEFGPGLNLLTGETGSGKSIIVDSLGALTGGRVSSDLVKEGEQTARIEGLFTLSGDSAIKGILRESGIEFENSEIELIVRRELSLAGKNRIFINNQLVTQSLLRTIGAHLVDIHGQGEQMALFDISTHLEMLDEFAKTGDLKKNATEAFQHMWVTKTELGMLEKNEAEKLQMLDILRFQVDEITRADLQPGEDTRLEEEKRRLNNIGKLSTLSDEAYSLLYDNGESTIATLEKAARRIEELAEFESKFREYDEGVHSAQAVLEDLAIAVRDFRSHLEFSSERLEEIENRLAEMFRLRRKYGESIEAVLHHLRESEERLENIETAEFREEELKKKLAEMRKKYVRLACELHDKRTAAARKFEKEVMQNLKAVALEKARFEVRIDAAEDDGSDRSFTATGFDYVEFYFSANAGESPRPLAKIASGGEASRLMLILKTVSKALGIQKSAVFDEIDVGIGGRVAEAVGLKLKELAKTQQVLCVTHQPQIASLADHHLVVEKEMTTGRTRISVKELDGGEQVEEIARMLAGEQITDAARANAKAMLTAFN